MIDKSLCVQSYEDAMDLVRILTDNDYVCMISREEQLWVVSFEYSEYCSRNDVVFGDAESYYDAYAKDIQEFAADFEAHEVEDIRKRLEREQKDEIVKEYSDLELIKMGLSNKYEMIEFNTNMIRLSDFSPVYREDDYGWEIKVEGIKFIFERNGKLLKVVKPEQTNNNV